MDRLTWEYKDGGMFVDGTTVKQFVCDDVEIYTGNAIIKLAKYEDTGLDPGEIKKAVVLAKAYIMDALKQNEKSIAILKNIGGDTHQIEAANTGLKNLLIEFVGQQQGHDSHVNKTCSTCEYWLEKYQKCENPEQPQSEADDYMSPPNKTCDLWESNR